MGWIGQHIYDLASRFRSDVFLEDIATGTIASGAHLGLDSNNKIVKAVDGGGDVTLAGAQTFTGSKTMATNVKLNFRDANSTISSPTANDIEIAATDIVLDAATSVKIETSDLTMYDPVNDGNPTISLGKDVNDRFEIKTAYNSGAQTLDEVYFNSYTTSTSANDGRFIFQVDEVELARFLDTGLLVSGNCTVNGDGSLISTKNSTASSATEGGKLRLACDDGAAMGDDHRLGVIEFEGAEDGSGTRAIGARIEAMCDAAWSGSENSGRLDFYVTKAAQDSGSIGEGELKVLTLDSDKLATFTGAVTVTGGLSGTLETVSQPNITGVGIIGTGQWRGTIIDKAYLDEDIAFLSSTQTFTGTKTLNSFKGTGATTVTNILDEDAMGSDSATALATQQSIKAYVDAKKQVMHYPTKGYAVGDGTNYEFQKPMGTNTAPFNFDDEAMGPDGVSNVTTQKILRAGGIVMPRDCTLTRWTGWAVSAGSSADTFIGLFKVTIARNENTNYNFVELEEFQYTALGNNKAEDFDISSGFTETAIAAGDIIFPGLKGASGAIQYFSGTFEVEF